MIQEIIYFIILFVLFFVLANPLVYSLLSKIGPGKRQLPSEWVVLLVAIIYAGIAWLLYYLMKLQQCRTKDGFHFEVTPKVSACENAPYQYCPPEELRYSCCPRGFDGRPIGFSYSADWERGANCPCGCPGKHPNNPNDYRLGSTEWTCPQCPGGSEPQPQNPIMGIPVPS